MGRNRNKSGKRRSGLQVVTLCISTGMVLVLLGMVVLTVFTGHNLSNYVKENLNVTMVLSPETSDAEGEQLTKTVRTLPYIAATEFVSKEQVLKEGTKEMGTDPSEFVGENPFTPEITLRLHPEYANNDSLKWIANTLKTYQGVERIEYPKDLVESVNKTLGKISVILIVLAALLSFVSFELINNTVRLSVYSRRFTIHTMKLVGASWNFIRAPFLKTAVIQGLVSALLAIVVLGGGLFALYNYENDITTVITPEVMIITAAILLVFGVVITTFCSGLSVNKFLKMKAGDLYKI